MLNITAFSAVVHEVRRLVKAFTIYLPIYIKPHVLRVGSFIISAFS